jgi:putative tryptophan/tyrosine transport system substrate-binding protein
MCDMRRREFIALLGGAAATWPLAARAQQGERMRRIGVLMPFSADDPEGRSRLTTFVQAIEQLGWIEGRNLRIEPRWGGGNTGATRKFGAELVALAPDVILANGSATVEALLQATRTVPIVFTIVADPVGAGYVDSLVHGRAATSQALPTSNIPSAGNGWSCSGRSPRGLRERRYFAIPP